MEFCIELPEWWWIVALGFVYGVGWLIAARALAWCLFDNSYKYTSLPNPDRPDCLNRIGALLLALAWPLVFICYLPFIGMKPRK